MSRSMLGQLLNHPDFQRGVADAESCFEEYYDSPLTEDEMIKEIETNLSRATVERSKAVATALGKQHPSYIHHLGFVLGTINQGLERNSMKTLTAVSVY